MQLLDDCPMIGLIEHSLLLKKGPLEKASAFRDTAGVVKIRVTVNPSAAGQIPSFIDYSDAAARHSQSSIVLEPKTLFQRIPC